jgi:hypothetical protein
MRYFFVLMVSLFLWGTSATLYAQVSVNFNIGVQPIWGPTGYDYAEYYYFPDIDCYYYIPQHRFYYFEGGRWIYRSSLPSRFGNFDLYNSYKVVVNERDPWRNDQTYRQKYASYKGHHDQQPIRDSRDSKYFVNPSHPQHNVYVQQQKQNNGNHFGQNKGNVAPIGNNRSPVTRQNIENQGPTTTRQNTVNQRPTTTRQNTGNQRPTVTRQNTGNQRPTVTRQNTGNQRPTVTRQNTGNQRPAVVKQNNGNKGNNGKGNGNVKGNGGRGNGNGNDKENGKGK